MVDSKAWSFIKRHKGKFIIGGIVLAGSIYITRKIKKKIDELTELFENNVPRNEIVQDNSFERSLEWKMSAHFRRNQQVSDTTVRKILKRVKDSLYDLFVIDQITGLLREQGNRLSPRDKATHFNKIKVQCISRLLSAIYILNLSLLLHRVEINVIGSQSVFSEFNELSMESNFSFLSSTRYIYTTGMNKVVEIIQKCVEKNFENINPPDMISTESLKEIFLNICKEANDDIIYNSRLTEILLPDNIQLEMSKELNNEFIEQNLNETRDILDSQECQEVLALVINENIHYVIELIQEKCTLNTFPLAKVFARTCEVSDYVLAHAYTNNFIEIFSKIKPVEELCTYIFKDSIQKANHIDINNQGDSFENKNGFVKSPSISNIAEQYRNI